MNGTTPRILHFVPGFRLGGIESLLMSLYRSLDKSAMQFDFMVDTLDDLPEFDEIRTAGGRVFQMGRYLDNPISYQLKVEKILKNYSSEYLALHSHTVIRALPILLSAFRHGIDKRIVHSHTDSLGVSKQAIIGPSIAKITNIVATDYWACSNAAGEFFFKNKPYKVFNNTITTKNFIFSPIDGDKVRSKLGFDKENLIIGHTGRFTHQKNHEFLIQAFNQVYILEPQARLLLVGDGPLMPEIKKLVNDLDIRDVVKFVGSQSDIPAYLSAMDVFFLPSHYEGFCISLLEAQANGLPCLASDVIPDEVQVTALVTTFSLDSTFTQVASNLLGLHKEGRAQSLANTMLIQQAGYDTDMQMSNLIGMYSDKSS